MRTRKEFILLCATHILYFVVNAKETEEGPNIIVIGGGDRPAQKGDSGWPMVINTADLGNDDSHGKKTKAKGTDQANTIIIFGDGHQNKNHAHGHSHSHGHWSDGMCCDCHSGEPTEAPSNPMPIVVKTSSEKKKRSKWKDKKTPSSTIIFVKAPGATGTARQSGGCCSCQRRKPAVMPILVPVTPRRRRRGKCKGQKVIVKKIIKKPVRVIRRLRVPQDSLALRSRRYGDQYIDDIGIQSASSPPDRVIVEEYFQPVIRKRPDQSDFSALGTVVDREEFLESASNPVEALNKHQNLNKEALLALLLLNSYNQKANQPLQSSMAGSPSVSSPTSLSSVGNKANPWGVIWNTGGVI